MSGAASRDTLARARKQLDQRIDRGRATDLSTLADELTSVVGLLDREHGLRRALADPAAEPDRRAALLDAVLGNRLGPSTTEVLRPLVRGRWSQPRDLTDALEMLGQQAALGVAELSGTLDEVEDELFRFGRVLDAQPRLRQLLEDASAPTDRRVELLDRLIGRQVNGTTRQLLDQAVRSPRGRTLERAVGELVELAAARRERYVAYVTAPAPLTAAQEQRLTTTLARIYGRPVSIQVAVDPAVLGGLVVRVNDEVIDGSVLSRLTQVRHRLAG
ncbi:MAG TPA: F0F1 ATP synthase subunit delta [Mycobacteriales bacterium]|nr:F0F1 ATP synthase subunit delta [Mycobacteriales bacterium]